MTATRPTPLPPEPASGDEPPYLNRELSWIDFNARVLALAADPNLAVLERAKFLAIFSENLDEFFQVRVAGLKDQVAAGLNTPAADGRTPTEQLRAVRAKLEVSNPRYVPPDPDESPGS